MSKNTAQEIIDLGFTFEMFRKDDDAALLTFVAAVLAEQTLLLEGRIGAAAYAAASSPQKDYVKRLEKCLVAAELFRIRINILTGNRTGTGEPIDTEYENKQRDAYLAEASMLIDRVVNAVTTDSDSDIAIGAVTSHHFSTAAEDYW